MNIIEMQVHNLGLAHKQYIGDLYLYLNKEPRKLGDPCKIIKGRDNLVLDVVDMYGYIFKNRSCDTSVLVYIPIQVNYGITISIDIKSVQKIGKTL